MCTGPRLRVRVRCWCAGRPTVSGQTISLLLNWVGPAFVDDLTSYAGRVTLRAGEHDPFVTQAALAAIDDASAGPPHRPTKEQHVTERLKAAAPLAISVGILAAVWLEISLNFSFHWITEGNLGNGLALPANFTVVAPAALVSWSMFFAAGVDRAAAGQVALASTVGAVGAFLAGLIAPKIAGLPDFYGIALTAGVIAGLAVLAAAFSDYYYIPAVFCGLLRRYVLVDRDRAGRLGTRRGRDRQHGCSSPQARNGGIRGFPRRSAHPSRMGLHLQRGLVARWAPFSAGRPSSSPAS
jgi:Protein of unknown function (DUF1097)